MAITLMFGLPGAGKTTVASQICVDEAYKIKMGQSNYTCVLTNAPITCEGVYYCDNFDWLGTSYVKGALIVIDEATLLWDSRNYKLFAKNLVKGFVLHRHTHNDVVVFVQIWNRLDKTIRDICDKVYYLHKGVLFNKITYMNHIPYHILFPEDGNNAGDIVMGYKKCSFWQRVFSKRLYRPLYYDYFDSFWIPPDMTELKPDEEEEIFNKFWLDHPESPLWNERHQRIECPLSLFDKLLSRLGGFGSCRKYEEYQNLDPELLKKYRHSIGADQFDEDEE